MSEVFELHLPSGHTALVDASDRGVVEQYRWHALQLRSNTYVQCHHGDFRPLLHRFLTGAQKGEVVDHINHNGLDNRRSNLRVGSMSQNLGNARMFKHNRSGLRGVSWRPDTRRWRAHIQIDGKQRGLGCFDDPWEAAQAYNAAAVEAWGEFAQLNEYAAVRDLGLPDPLSRKDRT